MTESSGYLFEVEDNVGLITLNRPDKLNPIDWELGQGLSDLFQELRERDDVRAIILSGAGRAFSAGGDAEWLSGGSDRVIPGVSPREAEQNMPRWQRKMPAGPIADVTNWIINVDKPVLAALHGPVMGAGLGFRFLFVSFPYD